MMAVVTTEEARNSFYPTPPDLAAKMLEGLDLDKIQTVLEPSAGSGNLIEALAKKCYVSSRGHYDDREYRLKVDAIEIDPSLQAILTYSWGEGYEDALRQKINLTERKWDPDTRSYIELTDEEKAEKREYQFQLGMRYCIDLRLAHDDFLTYASRTKYDLIVMNPPFADGDAHLLKAIMLMEPYGGEIRCLLNAETIRNPYSNRRKVLLHKLTELGATISFSENAFMDAERPTGVEVAIISVSIPTAVRNSHIWDDLKKAAEAETFTPDEVTDVAPSDFVEATLRSYNMEIDAGLSLIREFKAMQPYIRPYETRPDHYYGPESMLTLRIGDEKETGDLENRYIRAVRRKYWTNLLNNDKITSGMTSNLQNEYRSMVSDLVNYEFSECATRS